VSVTGAPVSRGSVGHIVFRLWQYLAPRLRVLSFSGLVALAAVLLSWLRLSTMGALPLQPHVTWWELAVGFAVVDVLFDIHSDTYALSLMEIPLVMGLFLANPLAVVVGRVLGTGLVLALYRRQPPLKLFFNASLLALESAVAVTVFRALLGPLAEFGSKGWGPAFAAVVAANLISYVCLMAVVALSGGVSGSRGLHFVVAVVIMPLASTSLALRTVAVLQSQPVLILLLGVIAAALMIAYRAHVAMSRRYANLQRLYEFTQSVQDLATAEDPVIPVLVAAREVMRAGTAELALVSTESESEAFVSRVTGGERIVGQRVGVERLGLLWREALDSGAGIRAASSSRAECVRSDLTFQGHQDVLIVPLPRDGRDRGTMMVADRQGDVATFDDNDLRLFETLVNHAAVALDRRRLIGRLEHDALHDGLTGLPNRVCFDTLVRDAIARRSPGRKLAVMIMDLDRFKEVNDTLGHHHGDRLLQEIGARLESSLGTEVITARLGGDEFAILLGAIIDGDEALEAARRILHLVRSPFPIGDLTMDVGASIGIALCPDHGEDAQTLLQRADVAMYSAKESDQIEFYSRERDHYSPKRLALVGQLRRVIDNDELEVYYQAKADLDSHRIVGAEALIRWLSPDGYFIPPDDFIPLAEHTGLIRPLTRQVLRKAIDQRGIWGRMGLELKLSVNLSVRDLLDPELAGYIETLLCENGLNSSSIMFEVTESSIMSDPAKTIEVLEDLHAMGIGLSVDDFGTGYSSLTYLKQLPVSEVKIDKSFVTNVTSDPNDVAIVRSIADLGGHFGLSIVAEGVEDQLAWDTVRSLGCTLGQGYHLARPLPSDEFEAWVAEYSLGQEVMPSVLRLARDRSLHAECASIV
jgi:diguanylate cyclase (GGDEF)-like protein